MRCSAMCARVLVAVLVTLLAVTRALRPHAGRGALRTSDSSSDRICPHYCTCYTWRGLRRADCTDHKLNGVEVGLPRSVEVADLTGNLISSLDDGCFQALGLVQLRELSLRRNAIQSVGLFAFAGMRRLGALDLSYNRLQSLFPDTFAANLELKVLLIAGNNFAHLSPSQPLLRAARLQVRTTTEAAACTVYAFWLESLGCLFIRNRAVLDVLDVSSCQLAHLSPPIFDQLPALASLNLSSNYLIELQEVLLKPLKKLQEVDLSQNPLNCDPSTVKVVDWLRAKNVTLSQPCATVESAVESAGEGRASPLPQPKPEQQFERMIDVDSFLSRKWFEGTEKSDVKSTRNEGGGEAEDLGEEERECVTSNATLHDTGNPKPLKEMFDIIPSFWASILGFQVGLAMGLACSAICRVCYRCRGKPRSSCHEVSESAWHYMAVPPTSATTEPTDALAMYDELGSGWTEASISLTMFDEPCATRAETPPPPYHELMISPSANHSAH